jgi:hypothetical protein
LRNGDLQPWLRRIEKDIVEAAQRHILESAEITLKARDGRVFHPLARHKLFQNGARKFYVAFIETIPRQFLGRQRTSFLLAGLVLASRFRFAISRNGIESPAFRATNARSTASGPKRA